MQKPNRKLLSDYRTEDYYQLAWKSGREVVMEPYTEEDSAGVLISSVCVPIKKGEEVIGVCGIDFALKDFQVMVETIRPFGVGYGFLVSNNGVFVGHPDPGLLGKGIDSERWGDGTRKIERSIREGVEFSETFEQDGGVLAIGVPLRIGATDTPWSFGIIVPRQVITAGARQLVRMGAFIGLCALAVLFLAVYLVARVISEPLGRTAQMLLALEGGDLDSRLGMRRDDEIGRMARALDSFADHLRDEVLEAFQKLSQGNFTFRARGVIANPLARTNVALNMVMRQVQTLAGEVGKGAGQVSMSSRSLSRGAGEQAASLEEISSHVSEVETLTRKNVDSAAGMARVSGRARDLVREGAAKMEVMTGAMDEIRSSSQNIAKVIKVIEEIAFQTNLLALNAAVEAARAGQHGKGFAVVAEEVRNLAGRSAQAAQSTRDMIEDSISKAETGAEVSKTTAEFLAGIKENVDSMAGMMDAIAAGSEQQARAMSRIIEGVNQVSVVTEQNSASAEENASIAAALDSRVRELQRILNGFVLDGGDTGSNLGRERLESGMAEVGYECGSLSAGERLSRI